MSYLPPPLRQRDVIYCFCPCASVDYERATKFAEQLSMAGFTPILSSSTIPEQANEGYFPYHEEGRVADFNHAIENPNVRAIWCMRGGYGASRIVDKIKFEALLKSPKWFIGFSDITLFHCHLLKNHGVSSLHGLMSLYPNNGNEFDFTTTLNIIQTAKGTLSFSEQGTHYASREGRTNAPLIGGNLSLLAHSIGTASEPDWENKILFVEDVGEYFYTTERLFLQLKRRGVFHKIKGLIVGSFTQMKDTAPSLGKTVAEIVHDSTEENLFPIWFDFPAGHGERNYPLVHGGYYELIITSEKCILTVFLGS